MILIGLVTWSNHPILSINRKNSTLEEYSSYFPIVEVDSLFYRFYDENIIKKWILKVPKNFKFIIKASSFMTMHKNYQIQYGSLEQVFNKFYLTIKPLILSHHFQCILMQFPPSFMMNVANLNYLKYVSNYFNHIPIAIEFRHPSWYMKYNWNKVKQFMISHDFINVIPDVPLNVVPRVYDSTNKKMTIIRLHGRNYVGWKMQQQNNWRKTRNLYCYSKQELYDLSDHINKLSKLSKDICVIFNNNSNNDAAQNALDLKKILKIDYKDLSPLQLNIFKNS